MNRAYAHTRISPNGALEFHVLEEHLRNTARHAAEFAKAFDSEPWGYLAGMWHDLGKYQEEFQAKLEGENISVDHSTVGAVCAFEVDRASYVALAFVIAGHHAGLANWNSSVPAGPGPLRPRIDGNSAVLSKCGNLIHDAHSRHTPLSLPEFLKPRKDENPKAKKRRVTFWIRMLFSALVDADYLDTEAFMAPERSDKRGDFDSVETLLLNLRSALEKKEAEIPDEEKGSAVNLARAEILRECLSAAEHRPGLFSLTAPTGSGKTLSSMAFALHHARRFDLKRVVVVLPFTTIIEQNAAVYREIFDHNVLEHHSSLSARRQSCGGIEVSAQHDLAQENWDAPIIVTTTVQFFESLHANRPGPCRKLHRIARSVVILDEVQALSPGLLVPIADVLNSLLSDYGCSIVLSTATPPALERRESFPLGLPEPTPILQSPEKYFRSLARVRYQWPTAKDAAVEWVDLAEQLTSHDQVLVVVDRRADAHDLAKCLKERAGQEVYHLSTLMCPAHRLHTIDIIRKHLKSGEPCRVVSTQLIEAGVDLDFPVVYRALAGLDHIVQAAGRCNREGKHPCGEVIVFNPPNEPPRGPLRLGKQVTETILLDLENTIDTCKPELFERYFRQFYGQPVDEKNILREAQEFNFATIAQSFKLIDDRNQMAIVCPYLGEDGGASYDRALAGFRSAQQYLRLSAAEWRGLQPFAVQVYTPEVERLRRDGVIIELYERVFELAPGFRSRYDLAFGLVLGGDMLADPEELMC